MAVAAKGARIFDEAGLDYIDASSGPLAVTLGHGHPRVLAAIADQFGTVDYVHRSQFRNPAAALEFEIAQEKASALGRLGRRLEAALAALRAFDAAIVGRGDRGRRDLLVAEAGEALWYLMVQRDACGLFNSAAVIADYAVPGDVVSRVGPAVSIQVPGESRK